MSEERNLSYILLADELNELLDDMAMAIARIQEAQKPAAKPALAALVRSPDMRPTSHLVDPAHGSATLKG